MNFQEFDSRPTEIFDGIVEPLTGLSITERDITRVVVLNMFTPTCGNDPI